MPAWPATLPPPTRSGSYALRPQTRKRRTDMERGVARVRRIATLAPTAIPLEVTLTTDQLATFEAWYGHELKDGSLWFDMKVENGRGITTQAARVLGEWEAAPRDSAWVLRFEVEVRSLPILTALELAPRL
jgi:hypothetical protein